MPNPDGDYEITEGIHRDLPFDDYLAVDAISHSALKPAITSIAGKTHYDMDAFHNAWEAGKDEPTRAKSLGSFIHGCLLEPSKIHDEFAVVPSSLAEGILTKAGMPSKSPKSTAEYKQRLAEWRAPHEAAGKQIVEDSSAPAIFAGQMLALGQNKRALSWLHDVGERELSLVWRDPGSGLRCKGRIDMLCENRGILVVPPPWPGSAVALAKGCTCPTWYVDIPSMHEMLSTGTPEFQLKCPVHAHLKPAAFRVMPDLKTTGEKLERWNFWKYGVHTQLRSYSLGYQTLTNQRVWPAVILVTTTRPYRTWTAPFHPDTLIYAKRVYTGALKRIAECKKTGEWPGLPEPVSWDMPEWMMEDANRLQENEQ